MKWRYRGRHRARYASIRVVDLEPSYTSTVLPEFPSFKMTYAPIDRWRRLAGIPIQTVGIDELFASVNRLWETRI